MKMEEKKKKTFFLFYLRKSHLITLFSIPLNTVQYGQFNKQINQKNIYMSKSLIKVLPQSLHKAVRRC